jgi:hypothetical protein
MDNNIEKRKIVRINYVDKIVYMDDEKSCIHREDGPAVIYKNGSKEWYINGKHHREDGPAIIYYNGTKHWFHNGKHHRVDGPAIEWDDGEVEWYIDNVYFDTKELWFEALNEEQRVKALYSEYFIKG